MDWKRLVPSLMFIGMGALFLLICTVLYPSISQALAELEETLAWQAPDFWDLQKVLQFVRVIFFITGSFLTVFGIGLLISKKRLF